MKMVYLLIFFTLSFNSYTRETKETQVNLTSEKINSVLKEAHAKFKGVKEGKNADYIPALAKVPSELFGIALVTPDGKVYEVGDVKKEFSIQSIGKVFTLATVMNESGDKKVRENIGVVATGAPFNSITAIEAHEGKMQNPLVNPGAIATVSLIEGDADSAWSKILGSLSSFAGRDLKVMEDVYKSESETNTRNKAISYLMNAYGIIDKKPEQALDLYTRKCSIGVNARDLAVMASTLANGGKNPVTNKQVVEQEYVKGILAIMATAGLYDTTGNWLYETGLPAKSGVGGGLIAVAPGKFGVATFSPRLDEAGNSVRGQKAIQYIVEQLGANPYDVQPAAEQLAE